MAEAMLSEDHSASVPDFQEEEKEGRPKRGEGKTVVIQEPPPTKRRKVSSTASIQDIRERISSSLMPQDRDEAIVFAATNLDHNVQEVHDKEIAGDLDSVLSKHLALLLLKRQYQAPEDRQSLSREIANTCNALEMVHRASVPTVLERFKLHGGEVMALLLRAIDDELCNRLCIDERPAEDVFDTADKTEAEPNTGMNDDGSHREEAEDGMTPASATITFDRTEEGDMIICKACKTLGHFARVGDATQPMAYHPGLLSTLINVMAIQPQDAVPSEARLTALWVVANLACNAENMVMMACHPELLSSLIAIAGQSVLKSSPATTVVEVLRAQTIAIRALLNLSHSPENRVTMSEMAGLVQVLSKLTLFRQPPKRGRTIQEIVLSTRKQAVGTLRNLASAPRRSKIRLCEYENGLLLDILTDAVLNDSDEGVRRRAFATINNLAIHDNARAMVENPALVLALKGALSDDSSDLKASANGTLMVLERSITLDMDCYQNLRELLDAIHHDYSHFSSGIGAQLWKEEKSL